MCLWFSRTRFISGSSDMAVPLPTVLRYLIYPVPLVRGFPGKRIKRDSSEDTGDWRTETHVYTT